MKTLPVLGLAAALCALVPSTSSAQIISTMVPAESSGPASSGPNVAFHIMGGYTNWKFAFGNDPTLTETGGKNGFIGAADVVVSTGSGVAFGAGGWYNKVQDITAKSAGFTGTQTLSLSSVYGNVFAGNIGVQVGVVPLKSTVTASTFAGSVDDSQTDLDAFLVGRFGSTISEARRLSASVGVGMYRFGSRPSTRLGDASPTAAAVSAFANVSVPVISHVSVDASFWYTAKDKNYNADTGVGNPSQRRFVIGIGIQN